MTSVIFTFLESEMYPESQLDYIIIQSIFASLMEIQSIFDQISRHAMTMDNFLTTDPQVLVEMTDQRIACTRVAYFSGFFF